MEFLRMLIYCLTHKACPVCSGGHNRVDGGLCCMCGGEGVVTLRQNNPREVA